jgi:hypothetical protein
MFNACRLANGEQVMCTRANAITHPTYSSTPPMQEHGLPTRKRPSPMVDGSNRTQDAFHLRSMPKSGLRDERICGHDQWSSTEV